MRPGASALALVSGLHLLAPSLARADLKHTVARGHTVEAIANRYRVPAKSILEANHLRDGRELRPGDVLTIPKVDPPKAKPEERGAKRAEPRTARLEKEKLDRAGADKLDKARGRGKAEATSYAAKPKTPGVVHVKRIATTEEADVRVADRRSRVSTTALKAFEKLMRSPSGAAHPIEPRLLALLATVSNHFGSRKIEIVSGFRPYSPTQYTAHSNHNHGRAVDFRVVGVPNEVVRDYCRTLKSVGCGYYPNSVFVHMDVRDQSAFWIDYSKPGEPPRYNAANVDADEGTSDVHDEHHNATGATPSGPDLFSPDATRTMPALPAPTREPAPDATSEAAEGPAPSEPAD